ncbi:MAG TPA: tetratricopeptide repeat protein [Spongiibacteraceae bacterium]
MQTLHRYLIYSMMSAVIICSGTAQGSGSYGGSLPAMGNDNPQEEFVKAVEYINAGDYKHAISLLKRTDRAAPRNADVLNYLGYSYRKSGDQENGLKYYQKALDVEPNHRGANEYMGELYLEMNNLPKAEERLAVLANSCGSCAEYQLLAKSISAYTAAHPDGVPTSQAP